LFFKGFSGLDWNGWFYFASGLWCGCQIGHVDVVELDRRALLFGLDFG